MNRIFVSIFTVIIFTIESCGSNQGGNTLLHQNQKVVVDTAGVYLKILKKALEIPNDNGLTIAEKNFFSDNEIFVVADSSMFQYFPKKLNNNLVKLLTEKRFCELSIENSEKMTDLKSAIVFYNSFKDSLSKVYFVIANETPQTFFNPGDGNIGYRCSYTLLEGWRAILVCDLGKDNTLSVEHLSKH